ELALALVNDLAGDVHLGRCLGVDAVQGNFVAGDGDGDRHVVAVLVQTQVAVGEVEVEVVVGDVGVEFVLQFLGAVGGVEVVDVAAGVVAMARIHADARAGDLDGDLAILAILCVVGAAVAGDVIGAGIGLDPTVGGSKVVAVEEGATAGVVGQR